MILLRDTFHRAPLIMNILRFITLINTKCNFTLDSAQLLEPVTRLTRRLLLNSSEPPFSKDHL